MNHIDEGTIHAWLDGALDTPRAAEVEAHVNGCATCAAAVAEARGLIAGASRILSALDDVPAKVTPIRPPVAKRQWRAAPWVTAIAATLMLAVGITQWDRMRGSGAGLASSADSAQLEMSAPTADATAPVPNPVAAAEPAGGGSTVPTKRASPPASAPATSGTVAQRSPGAPPAAGQRLAERTGSESRRDARTEEARDVAVASAAPAEKRAARDEAAPKQSLAEVVTTAAPENKAALVAPARARVEEIDRIVGLSGCYNLADGVAEAAPLAAREQAVGASASRVRELGARAAAAPPAPAAAPERADFAGRAGSTSAIRLDTARTARGYVVRAQGADSTIIGSWMRVASDSVRVDLLTRGVFILARDKQRNCPD